MSQKILQVNFKFSNSRADYEKAQTPYGPALADFPGLRWKIWLMNEAEHEAGGLVLFDDEASMQAYIDGPLAGARSDATIGEISVKRFDMLEALTLVTRGPIREGTRV